MNIRLIVAIVLSMFIWFVFSPKAKKPENIPEKKESESKVVKENSGKELSQSINSSQQSINALKPDSFIEVPEKSIFYENEFLKIDFTNYGGAIKNVEIKKFKEELGLEKTVNFFLSGNESKSEFSLNYQMDINNIELKNIKYENFKLTDNQLTFTKNFNDILFEKIFVFNKNGYDFKETFKISNKGKSNYFILTNSSIYSDSLKNVIKQSTGFLASLGGVTNQQEVLVNIQNKIERISLSNKNEVKSFIDKGKIEWIAFTDKYFIFSCLPEKPLAVGFSLNPENTLSKLSLSYNKRELKSNETIEYVNNYYFGPKEINILKKIGKSLELSIDLGDWIGPISRVILYSLKFIQQYVLNWGIAIIILTIIIKFLLYPLNLKQFKSMKGMQKLQPKIAELKEKYKNDKTKLNIETMNLFKQNKINPMGGCFPLLLQMPVFFALFRVLGNSIELRHAPFFFWINDLSSPDKYFISPVIMGAMMFVQQLMTPNVSTDPVQAKMMKIMPLIFAFFMISLPSGLVIYILTNTIFSIIQQWFINKKVDNA